MLFDNDANTLKILRNWHSPFTGCTVVERRRVRDRVSLKFSRDFHIYNVAEYKTSSFAIYRRLFLS